jgi:hypothetical protein
MSVSEERGWREQYDRMLRWFERLHEAGDDERKWDDYYAFFVICYSRAYWSTKLPAASGTTVTAL